MKLERTGLQTKALHLSPGEETLLISQEDSHQIDCLLCMIKKCLVAKRTSDGCKDNRNSRNYGNCLAKWIQ